MFGGSVNFIEGKLKIMDDLSYGGMMSFDIDDDVAVELSYARMDTRAEWRPGYIYAPDYPNLNFDLSVNYMTIGAVREAEIADNIKGFGTLALGAAYFNPKDSGHLIGLVSVGSGSALVSLRAFFAALIIRLVIFLVFSCML